MIQFRERSIKVHAKIFKSLTIETLIEQVVVHSLTNLRAKIISRGMFEIINRITSRILNFFEENRMQFRIFTSVQNIDIMS